MYFSECAESSGPMKLSPDCTKLIICKSLQVKLYEIVNCLRFVYKWQVLDEITSLEWSPDGSLIMCCQSKRGIVHVFNSQNFGWNTYLNNGLYGIVNSVFCSDSRQILTFSANNLNVKIWNLVNGSTFLIPFPKFSKKGLDFSSDHKKFAILTRENKSDTISIYDTRTWLSITSIYLDFSAQNLFFLSDNSGIIVWSFAFDYIFSVFSLNGEEISRFCPYHHAPGLDLVSASPCENYFALCSHDLKIRILHHSSWVKFQELDYKTAIFGSNLQILRETEEFQFSLPDPNDKLKLQEILLKDTKTTACIWNSSQKFLVSMLKSLPNFLFVWETFTGEIEKIIVMKNSVKGVFWVSEKLVWMCGTSFLYVMDNEKVQVFDQIIPNLQKIDGKGEVVILQSKTEAIYARFN